MSDNVDSGDVQVDASVSQSGDDLQGNSDQPNSQTEQTDSLVKALLGSPEFSDKLSQAVQSQKDRRFSKIEQTQEEQKDRLDRAMELVQDGKSPTEAKNQIDLEDMIAEYRGKGAQQPVVASEATADNSVKISTLLKQAGVDPSTDYGKSIADGLVNTNFQSSDQANKAIIQEMGRLATKPTPNAASASLQGGGSPPTPDATEQYKNDMIANRGDRAKLRAIKAQAKKDGVDVHNVGFSL